MDSGNLETIEFTPDGRYFYDSYVGTLRGTYVEEAPGILHIKGKVSLLGNDVPGDNREEVQLEGSCLIVTLEDNSNLNYFPVAESEGQTGRDSDDQSDRRTIPSDTSSEVDQTPDQGKSPRDSTSDGDRFLASGEALFTATATTEQLNQAFGFFMKAAELGNADAEHRVGVAYATGKGVQKNESEAVRWYQKSADQGFAEAQCDLGVRYLHGQGVKKDERTGLKLIRKAAAQGYQEALDILKNRGLATDGQ